MTRSHKIGWLVLVLAVLFMLWRLPRLHGQGFGSFSHDQPYLAGDRVTSTASTPPLVNLQSWWHWEDVTNIATNWVDRISGFVIKNADTANALTNDGVGVYCTGATYGTNSDVEIFKKGVACVIVAKAKGNYVNGRFLVGLTPWMGVQTYNGNLIYSQSTLPPPTEIDIVVPSFLYNQEQMVSWSLESNAGAHEGWSNAVQVVANGAVYEDAHDNNYFGNSKYGTNSWRGYIYDILVYTNVYRWSTSSVPALSNVFAWYSNTYEAPITVSSPTNISGYPAFAWYVADNAYTNGATYVLPDLYTNAWHLTNVEAATKWPISSNAINGHAYLLFDGVNDYLKAASASNSQPTEFFIVSRFTTNAVVNEYEPVFDALYTGSRNVLYYQQSTKTMGFAAGNYLNIPYSIYARYTNEWLISNGTMYGTNSCIKLNGLSYPVLNGVTLDSDIGSQALAGLIVGNFNDAGYPSHLQLAEVLFFKTNLPLRLKNGVSAYLKTKYGL